MILDALKEGNYIIKGCVVILQDHGNKDDGEGRLSKERQHHSKNKIGRCGETEIYTTSWAKRQGKVHYKMGVSKVSMTYL